MFTAADLLMRFSQFILGRKDIGRGRARDDRDRIAAYLESVGDCLLKAAESLETRGEAWTQVGEAQHHLLALRNVVGNEFGDDEITENLYHRLRSGFEQDYFLSALSTKEFLPNDQEAHVRSDLTPPQREVAIDDELAKLRVSAGTFRAAAAQLRASRT